jgi:hypothetical protein
LKIGCRLSCELWCKTQLAFLWNKQTVEEMLSAEQNLQVELKKVFVAMEAKRNDFEYIRQDVDKVKKYASDLQTFIGVKQMTSVVDGEIEISDKNFLFCLSISEIFFVISDFAFSNAASMFLRSLSMCTMAVDDLAFPVTSRMGRNVWMHQAWQQIRILLLDSWRPLLRNVHKR